MKIYVVHSLFLTIQGLTQFLETCSFFPPFGTAVGYVQYTTTAVFLCVSIFWQCDFTVLWWCFFFFFSTVSPNISDAWFFCIQVYRFIGCPVHIILQFGVAIVAGYSTEAKSMCKVDRFLNPLVSTTFVWSFTNTQSPRLCLAIVLMAAWPNPKEVLLFPGYQANLTNFWYWLWHFAYS